MGMEIRYRLGLPPPAGQPPCPAVPTGNRIHQDEEMSLASDHIQEDLIHHDGKQGQNDLFEGDIKLTSEQKQEIASPIATHNAKKDGHWGEYGLGVVPYSIKG